MMPMSKHFTCTPKARKDFIHDEESTRHIAEGAKVHQPICGNFLYATTALNHFDQNSSRVNWKRMNRFSIGQVCYKVCQMALKRHPEICTCRCVERTQV